MMLLLLCTNNVVARAVGTYADMMKDKINNKGINENVKSKTPIITWEKAAIEIDACYKAAVKAAAIQSTNSNAMDTPSDDKLS
eukprot:1877718-Ditylum_brightwellii.AAC.1